MGNGEPYDEIVVVERRGDRGMRESETEMWLDRMVDQMVDWVCKGCECVSQRVDT